MSVDEGKHHVAIRWHDTGRGIIAALTGGESPHVGAVVVSVPRESLRGGATISCDTCIIPLPGHKDHIAAQQVAEALCCALNTPVSITAGIHMDDATPDDVKRFTHSFAILADQLIEQLTARGLRPTVPAHFLTTADAASVAT